MSLREAGQVAIGGRTIVIQPLRHREAVRVHDGNQIDDAPSFKNLLSPAFDLDVQESIPRVFFNA